MSKLPKISILQKYNDLNTGRFADNRFNKTEESDFRDFVQDFLDSFAAEDKGPNDTVGGLKLVIYATQEEAVRAGRPGNATLDQIKPLSVVCGNLARIDITPGGPVWLAAVYDDGQGPYSFGPGFLGLLDGSAALHIAQLPASKGLASLKWVLKDSPEALAANVPLYKQGTTYRENDLVRNLFGTFPDVKSVVFRANESGNDLPAPTRAEGDAYWSVFNPTPAPYFPWQTVTPDELRKLKAAAQLTAGRLYIVSPRMAPGEDDSQLPDIFVRALMETELEPTGWLLVASDDKPLVRYELATDTTTPVDRAGGAPTWEPGRQVADSLVWWQGKLYRVKQDIADSQSAPLGNTQYYDLVSDPALVALHTQQLATLFSQNSAHFLIVRPDGVRSYLSEWPATAASTPPGSTMTLYGTYTYAVNLGLAPSITLVLAPGSVLNTPNLGLANDPAATHTTLEGTGTLNGNLLIGNNSRNALVSGVTINGAVRCYSFGGAVDDVTRKVRLKAVTVTSATNALLVDYGFGGNYTSYVNLEAINCTLTSTDDLVRFYDQVSSFSTQYPAGGKANNMLRLLGNRITAPAGARLLNDDQGTLQFELAQNIYLGGVVGASQAYAVHLPSDEASGGSYVTLAYASSMSLDFAAPAQLLTATSGLTISGTTGRGQGKNLRLHLFNSSSAAVTLAWPAWTWRGGVPVELAAGKQATLSLECAWGSAESNVIAGYAAQP